MTNDYEYKFIKNKNKRFRVARARDSYLAHGELAWCLPKT